MLASSLIHDCYQLHIASALSRAVVLSPCRPPLAQQLRMLTGSWEEFDSTNHLKGCKWQVGNQVAASGSLSCTCVGLRMAPVSWHAAVITRCGYIICHQNSTLAQWTVTCWRWYELCP